MYTKPEKTLITIKNSKGDTYSAEIAWDCNADDIMEALNGLMISAGYSEGWLNRFCVDRVEEHGLLKDEQDATI